MRSRHDHSSYDAIRYKEPAETPQHLLIARLRLEDEMVLVDGFLNLVGIDNPSIMASHPVEQKPFDGWNVTPHKYPRMMKGIAAF